jgi:ABC-type phosphate/phosphonate transport system permease subunit
LSSDCHAASAIMIIIIATVSLLDIASQRLRKLFV